MSILVNKNTRLICQGITGKAGAFHSEQCKDYGTNLVGGVTPGRGGETAVGVPVFDTCAEAVKATGANATMIFVPAAGAADAIMEAADAGIAVIIAITEGIPVLDMARAVAYLKEHYPQGPADRPELPRRDHARRMQDRHHAGLYSQAGQRRRGEPFGHPDVRRRLAAHQPGHRPEHVRRHRRRPGQWHQLRRCPAPVRGRSRTPTPC